MTTVCALCATPVGDADVCSGCGRRLELALGDVPALEAERETVLARLTAYNDQAQRVTGDREASVPFDKRASEVGQVLRVVLTSWVRIVWEERYDGKPGVRFLPTNRVAACAGWLLGRPAPGEMPEHEWMRHQRWADEAYGNILDAVADVRRVLDAPTNRATIHVGPCPELGCDGEVRAFIPRDPDTMAHADCTEDAAHQWDPTQWLRLGKRMIREVSA